MTELNINKRGDEDLNIDILVTQAGTCYCARASPKTLCSELVECVRSVLSIEGGEGIVYNLTAHTWLDKRDTLANQGVLSADTLLILFMDF